MTRNHRFSFPGRLPAFAFIDGLLMDGSGPPSGILFHVMYAFPPECFLCFLSLAPWCACVFSPGDFTALVAI